MLTVSVAYSIRQHMKLDLEIFLPNQSSLLLLPIFVLVLIGYRRVRLSGELSYVNGTNFPCA